MKTALITGASGGIGIETVKTFLSNGYFTIAMCNKNQQELLTLKKSLLNGLGDYLHIVKCDLSNEENLSSCLNDLSKSFKHIDVLVNNAGVSHYALITDTTNQEFQNIFDINVKSAFILSKWVLNSMISRKQGKIINVSSVGGVSGASMEVAYSSSKSALIGFTKALAKEVAPSNITVNCVCPGVIDTKMNAKFSSQEIDEIIRQIPLQRLGKASEVASLIYFLASDGANYITGQTITIDGGYIL